MRIDQIPHRFPPRTGGVERHVEAISRELSDDHVVTVRPADRQNKEREFDWQNGYAIARLRSYTDYHLSPVSPLEGRRGADVVHCHNAHSIHPMLAAAGVGESKLVVSPHYHGFEGRTDAVFGPYRSFLKRVLHRADRVVSVSEYEQALLADDLGVDSVVIPHGLDYESIRSEDDVEDGDYALFVGRLVDHKNPWAAIRAARNAGLEMVVVGDGPLREELENSYSVDFRSHVTDDELARLYRGASVLFNPSSEEAFGMVVGEALARGTPCVVNPKSGLSRWAGTRGVETASPEHMGAAASLVIGSCVDRRPLPSWSEVALMLEEVYQ